MSDSSVLEFSLRRVGDEVGGYLYVQREPESISESRHARRARCVVRRRVVARSRLMTNSRLLRKVPCNLECQSIKQIIIGHYVLRGATAILSPRRQLRSAVGDLVGPSGIIELRGMPKEDKILSWRHSMRLPARSNACPLRRGVSKRRRDGHVRPSQPSPRAPSLPGRPEGSLPAI